MNPLLHPPQTSIPRIGGLARACLVHGLSGQVLASFSNAIYLMANTGELFWLAAANAPLHRRGIRVDFPLPRIPETTPFMVEGTILRLDRLRLELGQALEWNAPLADPARRLPAAGLTACVEETFTKIDYSQAKGFGVFIPDILGRIGLPVQPQGRPGDPVLDFARPQVMQLVQGCIDREYSVLPALSAAIIGLGQGLTPSGDDFLGGLLFCLRGLGDRYSDLEFPHPTIPLEDFAGRTHPISSTLLNDLAEGHGIAPLHELFNGLVAGDSSASIHPSLLQLLGTGHSTGWDLLTGLLTGLLAACTSRADSLGTQMPAFQA